MDLKKHIVSGVIFDMDGVFADTTLPLLDAWKKTLNKHGVPADVDAIKSLVLGVVDYDKVRRFLVDEFSFSGDTESLIEEAESYYRSIVPLQIKPLAGLTSFLERLQKKSVDMVVGTSASRITMNVILDALKISPYFKYHLCSDDVSNRKPHPEVFQRAADLLGVDYQECLVFEDAPLGIQAAKELNMTCVALATTFPEELLDEADHVIYSFEEFPWEFFTFQA